MLKLMMGHSQSSNMGKTYYNVGEGSIGSVVGERASALELRGRVFPLCSGARWVLHTVATLRSFRTNSTLRANHSGSDRRKEV